MAVLDNAVDVLGRTLLRLEGDGCEHLLAIARKCFYLLNAGVVRKQEASQASSVILRAQVEVA
jgi:hypothetical protein